PNTSASSASTLLESLSDISISESSASSLSSSVSAHEEFRVASLSDSENS
ncbi:hypothetical protein Tco_0713007, partial [Tanacetum coccineum]